MSAREVSKLRYELDGLRSIIASVAITATPYGVDKDGWIAHYLVSGGAVNQAIAYNKDHAVPFVRQRELALEDVLRKLIAQVSNFVPQPTAARQPRYRSTLLEARNDAIEVLGRVGSSE